MATVSFGSFSITDFNDAISLSGYIGSNLSKYQIYNPDNGSYSPDFTSTNLVLTPELYVTSSPSDVITSTEVQEVKWYRDGSTTPISANTDYGLSGTKSQILTVKTNILAGQTGTTFTCKVTYKDATTNLTIVHKMDIALTKVSSGGGIADALATTPQGNIFKNGGIASLNAECFLWRGSVKDTTNVEYQWYAQDSSVVVSQGGGVGWRKLTEIAGTNINVTSGTMTVYPTAVLGVQVYKCIIKDTDSGSNSYNQEFVDYVSFTDLSDPIQCTIQSSGGDTFVNGTGSSILTARLFQAGAEIDVAGSSYTYRWYKYDKDSVMVINWGGAGVDYKTGKTLSVGDADVAVKATFKCEIIK